MAAAVEPASPPPMMAMSVYFMAGPGFPAHDCTANGKQIFSFEPGFRSHGRAGPSQSYITRVILTFGRFISDFAPVAAKQGEERVARA
jgi:hypothetical protein